MDAFESARKTGGPGGVHCSCCGGEQNKTVRRRLRQALSAEVVVGDEPPAPAESMAVDHALLALELSKCRRELSVRETELADARRMNDQFVRALKGGWCLGCTYSVEHVAFVTALLAAYDMSRSALAAK